MEYPLNQSAWTRAKQDTISSQTTAKFMWAGESVLAVIGGTWLAQIAPIGASTLEIVARSVIGGLGGLVVAVLGIFVWNLFSAPYKQRNEGRRRIKNLEAEFQRPKLFDILCRTYTLGLPINKLDNGSYRASTIGISPSPLQILHRGELTTINRFTMTPKIIFVLKDNKGWQTTTDITLLPSSNPLASSRTRHLSWDAANPDQWVLTGLPLTLAKDESLTLPMMMISVEDGSEVGSRLDKGETCILKMSFGIFTNQGSPLLPDQQISLTRSDIKASVYPIPDEGTKQ